MFKSKLKEKRVYLPIAILVASIGTLAGLSSLKQPPEEKEAEQIAPLVKVEPIQFAPMQLEVNSQGVVTPKFKTQLVAQVSGEISFLAPEFVRGGFVKKGQILARINDSDYQSYVIEAGAALLSAKAGLQTEEALGAVAKDEWSRIKNKKPTALSLRQPQLAQEQARVRAAEAALARAESNLERTYIRAPYHAMIEARQVGLGAYVNPGSPVADVLSVSEAEVRLPVADNQLQFLINEGVGANVVLRGELQGQQTEWQAKVIRTEGVIDNQSRMAYLVAELVNPYGLEVPKDDEQKLSQITSHPLRFGSYVRASVAGVNIAQAALVPRHLIVDGRLPVLTSEHTLVFKKITSLREQGAMVVVVDGVQDQDQLIVSALQYPVEGMVLRLPGEKKSSAEKADEESPADSEKEEALAKKSD